MPRNKSIFVFAVLVIFIACILFLLRLPATENATAASSNVVPRKQADSRSEVVALPAAAINRPSAPQTPAPFVPGAAGLLSEIHGGDGVRALLEKYRNVPDPTGEISHRLARLVGDCVSIVGPSLANARNRLGQASEEATRKRQLDVLETQVKRCAGFENGAEWHSEVAQLQSRAEAAGYPGAEASKLVADMGKRSREESDAIAIRLLETSNPDALNGVYLYLGRRNPPLAPIDPDQIRSNQFAWMLLQCDAGQDCGANSRFVTFSCTGSLMCGRTDFPLLLRAALSPGEYQTVIARKEALQQWIRQREWARLGVS